MDYRTRPPPSARRRPRRHITRTTFEAYQSHGISRAILPSRPCLIVDSPQDTLRGSDLTGETATNPSPQTAGPFRLGTGGRRRQRKTRPRRTVLRDHGRDEARGRDGPSPRIRPRAFLDPFSMSRLGRWVQSSDCNGNTERTPVLTTDGRSEVLQAGGRKNRGAWLVGRWVGR
jgi:hypothetical protein